MKFLVNQLQSLNRWSLCRIVSLETDERVWRPVVHTSTRARNSVTKTWGSFWNPLTESLVCALWNEDDQDICMTRISLVRLRRSSLPWIPVVSVVRGRKQIDPLYLVSIAKIFQSWEISNSQWSIKTTMLHWKYLQRISIEQNLVNGEIEKTFLCVFLDATNKTGFCAIKLTALGRPQLLVSSLLI